MAYEYKLYFDMIKNKGLNRVNIAVIIIYLLK